VTSLLKRAAIQHGVRMSTRLVARHALAAALALISLPSLACGPDFPLTLLDQRGAVLGLMPEGSFGFEAARIASLAGPPLPVVEDRGWSPPEPGLREAEAAGLSAAEQAQVLRMRAQDSVAAALAEGAGLAPAVLHYSAGAAGWHASDTLGAIEQFEQVLALPVAEQGTRGPMALYMLGRIRADVGEFDAARELFAQLRSEVQGGRADPLGLAAASLGEEARIELNQGDLEHAITLYAQQASLGSTSGSNSLMFVVRDALPDPAKREQLMQGEHGRRLLVAYLFARSHELPSQLSSEADTGAEGFDPWAEPNPPDSAAVVELLQALGAVLPANDPARDRLSAVAYRAGRFDDAGALVGDVSTPLAHWVRAKLALRAGDPDAAAAAYARAAEAFPAQDNWGPTPLRDLEGDTVGSDELKPACRVRGEAGTLALSRGDFVQALELLYAGAERYWTDTAYVAERVVTVDELKAFVERVAPQAGSTALPELGAPRQAHEAIRALLARRLLREGRDDEALAFIDAKPLREPAARYVEARAASLAGDPLDRARAGYAAAAIAREHGLELLGYEGDPDYAEYSGMYDLHAYLAWERGIHDDEGRRLDLTIEGDWTSDGERARVAESRAQPLHRYHYRGLAANLAEQAAAQLPPRSQAFAAVMCSATRYVLDADPERAQQLYRRYLREGAYVPWGGRFGQDCPAPDFDKVERELHAAWLARMQRLAAWTLPPVLLAVAGLLWWRRRKRLSAAG
jgi:hypothetical protein